MNVNAHIHVRSDDEPHVCIVGSDTTHPEIALSFDGAVHMYLPPNVAAEVVLQIAQRLSDIDRIKGARVLAEVER